MLASRLPTGELEVADGVGEDVFVSVCGSVWLKVPLYNTYIDVQVFVCLHVLVYMTGADSYVRGEVAPSLLCLGVCRGWHQLSE